MTSCELSHAIDLHAKVQGEGEPVILLHGLFGSWENLGSIARDLATQYQVHSLDLRNHGRSPHVEHMNYPVMAVDVIHYMNRVGIEQAHILGHSMGGKTAMQVALDASDRVGKLMVADIAPVRYPPRHESIIEGLTTLALDRLTSRTEADQYLSNYVKEVPVRQFLLKNLVKSGAANFQWRMNLPAIIKNYTAICDGQYEASRGGDAPVFDAPVLFIKGGSSDYITEKYQQAVVALFPKAKMRVIPNTGHWLHAEKPQLFLQIVRRFLTDQL